MELWHCAEGWAVNNKDVGAKGWLPHQKVEGPIWRTSQSHLRKLSAELAEQKLTPSLQTRFQYPVPDMQTVKAELSLCMHAHPELGLSWQRSHPSMPDSLSGPKITMK